MFGAAGAGKTTAAIAFPAPYVIDSEKGCENDQYIDAIAGRGGAVVVPSEWREVEEEVRGLMTERHDYRTLVIDSATPLYAELVDVAEKKLGNAHGRHHQAAGQQWKRLERMMTQLDMNVIITAREKIPSDKAGNQLDPTFDGPKGLDYLFDLVFRVSRRGRSRDRDALVVKSRCPGFGEGDVIPWTYDEIAERYGRAVLERDPVPTVLATPDLLDDIEGYLGVLGESRRAKMLEHYRVGTLEELRYDQAQEALRFLSRAGAEG
jgi:hypothetical protein